MNQIATIASASTSPDNLARANGATKFPWWPDWRGHVAAIVASGPSAKTAKVELLRNRAKVIAIKENHELCPWADVVYGCDGPFWRNALGLPKFKGLKISYARDLTASYSDIKIIDIRKHDDAICVDIPGVLGSGGNSGFQALNLTVQFGAKRILLIGFDMHDRSGQHWYGANRGQGRTNPSEDNFRRWRAAFVRSASTFAAAGIDVVNTSTISDIKCFRNASIESALHDWNA